MIINIDPNDYHVPKGARKALLLEACGILPLFAETAYHKDLQTAQELYDEMVEIYGYGDWSSGDWGTVLKSGTLTSNMGDPDMEPLVELTFPGNPVKVYIYQYAIMAVVGPEQTITSRMD